MPISLAGVSTNWLAFPLTIKEAAPFSRLDVVTHLETHGIQTRPIFSGNILRQPAYTDLKKEWKEKKFPVADLIMRNGFLIGCHQGLEDKHLAYMQDVFEQLFKIHRV